MSARQRKRTRRDHRTSPPPAKPDKTEVDLAELTVLWPRLDAALGRDMAGPSAASEQRGAGRTGADGSPAVIDLDTTQIRALVQRGLAEIAAEVIPLLRVDAPERQLAQLTRRINMLLLERNAARRTWLSKTPDGPGALAVIGRCEWEIVAALRRRDLVRRRWSTEGILEKQLPLWYAELRRRGQPLADHIAADVKTWTTQARRALNLVTIEQGLDWRCPFHRDEPAELRRVADQAVLAPVILAGKRQAVDEDGYPYVAPLHWRRSQAVYCPRCRSKWAGLEAMRILMRMIEQEDAREAEDREAEESVELRPRVTTKLQGPVCTGWFDDCSHKSCRQIRDEAPKPVRRHVLLLSGPDLARELKRSPQTIRAWSMAGFITKQGRDRFGRNLYDVEEVIGVSNRVIRRRRASLSTPERGSTRVPRARSRSAAQDFPPPDLWPDRGQP